MVINRWDTQQPQQLLPDILWSILTIVLANKALIWWHDFHSCFSTCSNDYRMWCCPMLYSRGGVIHCGDLLQNDDFPTVIMDSISLNNPLLASLSGVTFGSRNLLVKMSMCWNQPSFHNGILSATHWYCGILLHLKQWIGYSSTGIK